MGAWELMTRGLYTALWVAADEYLLTQFAGLVPRQRGPPFYVAGSNFDGLWYKIMRDRVA